MKKILCLLLALCMLAGCNAPAPVTTPTQPVTEATIPETTGAPESQCTIGLALPDEERWLEIALQLQEQLPDCRVETRFAEGDTQTQLEQLEELIGMPVDCLMVTPVDSVTIAQTLESAKEAGIPVMAWDGLLMETEGISCYVAPDYRAMGAAMGQAVVHRLGLDREDPLQKSYSVEFFMGPAEDHRALLLHTGLMEVLEPYLAAGVLACRSGRLSFEDASISKEDIRSAKWQSEALFTQYYEKDLRPDVIFTGSDVLAEGCIQALTELGCASENWPVITGQGSTVAGLRRVVSGKQTLTMWVYPETLLHATVDALSVLLAGEAIQTEYTLSNHIVEVPVIYCPALEIDGDNYEQQLIETGIYTLAQLTE